MQQILWRKINMRRDHHWAGPRMSAYVDGELGERQQARLAAHASICPECHRVLGTLRRMLSVMAGIAAPAPPPADRIAGQVASRIDGS